MKLHQNQKQLLILGVMVVLGSLLNSVPELLELYCGIEIPIYFMGTILITFLCGSFPGMLASAGSIALQYMIYTIAYDAQIARVLIPDGFVLYGVLIALILGRFSRGESYRRPWMILPITLLCVLTVTLLDEIIPLVKYVSISLNEAQGLEGIRMGLESNLNPETILEDLWVVIVNLSVSMAASLAVYHLISRKWREKLRTISWKMRPMSVAAARKTRNGTGKGRGHTLKSRNTILVTVSVCLSIVIIALIAINNMTRIVEEEYNQITGLSAEFAATLITPELAEKIEQKGAEAEGYEQVREQLQTYMDHTGRLSRLCVIRATEQEIKVLFDVAPDGEPVQNAGEILESKTTVANLFSPKFIRKAYPITKNERIGQDIAYSTIYPVQQEQAVDEEDSDDADDPPEALFHIISYVQTSFVSEYTILFVLRIITEFSGIFIILLSFAFWVSRHYLIYPIVSVSSQAKEISESLDDINRLNRGISELEDLNIHTADETETLYKAVCQMAQSVSAHLTSLQNLFHGTINAMVNAIDAKDQYTHGHSSRVAIYSRRIANLAGKSERECEEIYLSAILHDIGKIGIPGEIINKKGRLTDEEYKAIKQHPTIGYGILEDITEYPFLSVAARYHHERYDGRGYPDGLKGEEIPEIARIIAVADAYDAMTSNRSYRSAIPQHIVKEELIKGSGTQFDPQFARYMIYMIDHDVDYRMQETTPGIAKQSGNTVHHDCTDGYIITEEITRMRLCSRPDEGFSEEDALPNLIAFDSLDGRVHPGEENNRNLMYYEYARIRLDGQVTKRNIRKTEVRTASRTPNTELVTPETSRLYRIEAIRRKDHALIRIDGPDGVHEVILALPDNTRFLYLAISGDHCKIHNIYVKKDESVSSEEIPRIAEEISYIKGCPEGDIPNIEVDAWRTAATEGIPIRGRMKLSFHAMSLPTARMVWHCPFICVFSAENGQINGPGFREYILLRMDGESWESDKHVENKVNVEQSIAFAGWDDWKDRFRAGIDCTVTVSRVGNRITMQTENLGMAIISETTILDQDGDVLLALTGDQCAITNIQITTDDQSGSAS